jgi:hypothetical protein
MDFLQVRKLGEALGVSEGNMNHSVMSEDRHRVEGGGLLPSARPSGGREDGGVLSMKTALGPEATGGIPEGLRESTSRQRIDRRTCKRDGHTFHWAGIMP